MRKTILTILSCMLLLAFLSVSVSADEQTSEDEDWSLARLTDSAYILSDNEYDAILARLDEVSERQGCDIVIVTIDSLEEEYTPTEFADDVFDYYGFGIGEYRSGILFLLSMEYRDWAISTCGYGITAFTDAGQEYIFDLMKDDLSNDDYASAFNTFVDQCDLFITQAKTGDPYDTHNLPIDYGMFIWAFIFCLIFGVLISFFITNRMEAKLKSVNKQTEAKNYIAKDSLFVTCRKDIYLRSNTTKSLRQTSDSSSSSGGSSTHTSSSGTTHGGSSGQF